MTTITFRILIAQTTLEVQLGIMAIPHRGSISRRHQIRELA
jgi:hypothetical protein